MGFSRMSGVKLLTLVITLVCLILHYMTMGETETLTVLLAAGTFVGYTIILIALFAGFMIGAAVDRKLDLFFSIIGCVLFIVVGALIIHDWENKLIKWSSDSYNKAIAKGSLAIINGIIFLLDFFFTCRN